MSTPIDAGYAHELDRRDELARFRDEFVIDDPDLIYLDGNSLGRMPKRSAARIHDVVEHGWGGGLIRGWGGGGVTGGGGGGRRGGGGDRELLDDSHFLQAGRGRGARAPWPREDRDRRSQ